MVVSGKPRRYLIFYGNSGLGGWNDYFRSFDDPRNAQKEIQRLQRDYPKECAWWHIIDVHTGTMLMEHTPDKGTHVVASASSPKKY